MSLFSTIVGASSGVQSAGVLPEGVDLDGVNDYFYRTSDLVGNIDSNTFTFSALVYRHRDATNQYIYSTDNGSEVQFGLYFNTSNQLVIVGRTGSTVILASTVTSPLIVKDTFLHILISLDLTNIANRHVYINDIPATVTWGTYTSSVLYFTNNSHILGGNYTGSRLQGRLSHVFLDYTYRDLSIEANRRLFITADGKPANEATLEALSPIMYFKMKDSATAHVNSGTGGDMLQAGTIATSERGANQDNCVASYFDGTADYLSRTNPLTGSSQTKQLTFSCNLAVNTAKTYNQVFSNTSSSSSSTNIVSIYLNDYNIFFIVLRDATNTVILSATVYDTQVSPSGAQSKRTFNISFSVDMTDVNKRSVYINGNPAVNVSWNTYTNGYIQIQNTYNAIGRIYAPAGSYFNGNIGELWFDTTYTDLATDNPFWDSSTNRPKPVRQVMSETGTMPLIAMPLDASSAGKNYGSGGDFTANSAPYVGARGMSEYIARSVTTGIGSYLTKTSSSVSLSKTFTLAIYMKPSTSSTNIESIAFGRARFYLRRESTNYISIFAKNSSSTLILDWVSDVSAYTSGVGALILLSIDMSSVGLADFYINNIAQSLGGISAYTNDFIAFNDNSGAIAVGTGYDTGGSPTYTFTGDVSFVYFTTDYIDFSQESNRLKFIDGLGYPLDLAKQIDAGVIPKPLIYLPFDDPSNLGKNLGTGGDFTVNGTVTAGADVLE